MNFYEESPITKLSYFGSCLMTMEKVFVDTSNLEKNSELNNVYDKMEFYWAFCFLPTVFSEWETGVPEELVHWLNDVPEEFKYSPLAYCVMRYFNLFSISEFEHLFVANRQRPDIYGGVRLHETSDPWEIGANIMWYIKSKMKNN